MGEHRMSRIAPPSSTLSATITRRPSSKTPMDSFLQDVRYGLRTLGRQPGFAATAILTLALGIGATTAIFSAVNAVVLRPLPFDAPDRIVVVTNEHTKTGVQSITVSGPDFHDWREQSRSFDALAYYAGGDTSVTVDRASDYASAIRVTPGYFRVFGATAQVGRLLTDEEEQPGGPPSVVITDAFWRRQLAERDDGADGGRVGVARRQRALRVDPLLALRAE
jgi:putative ABC transport system permease protein